MALRQCPKRLWLQLHRPELAERGTESLQLRNGQAVGEAARQIYNRDGQGALVQSGPGNFPTALAQTRELLEGRHAIFEACVQAEGVHVYADALLPAPGEGDRAWRMVEVKSSTRVKAHHLDDAAIQAYAVRAAGIPVTGIALAHIDSNWTYPGGGDYEGLLVEADLTDETLERTDPIAELIEQATALATQAAEPRRHTGPHCTDPYPCPFFSYCSSQEAQAEHPVSWLPDLRRKSVKEHIAATGAIDMRDVPDDLLTARQQRVKQATLTGRPYFDRAKAQEMLRAFQDPLYFLDFETIQFAVPIWADTKPYQQIPFQFSLHWQEAGGFRHTEFLDLSGDDPQRAFAQALLAACGTHGAIVAYNAGFEKSRVKELAGRFTDLKEPLLALQSRVVDLLPVARECYYHPAQQGSWSIKAVLPALCPDLDYGQLDGVQDGTKAQLAYLEAIAEATADIRRDELRAQLLEYCKLDTWAMVRVWQVLSA